MQITLIRHLPTEWNKKTWLQGRKDIPLSPLSEEQLSAIKKNQELIRNLPAPNIVLSSTLKRTQQTAIVYGYEPEIESLLDELDFGPYEGKPKEQLVNDYKYVWMEKPSALTLGEDVINLEKRIQEFIKQYRDYSHVLVFGHGSWIRAFLSYMKFGHINQMNKITVNNNDCITLKIQ